MIEWLEHFGTEHGVGSADLERFDQLAKPNWLTGGDPDAAELAADPRARVARSRGRSGLPQRAS